MVKISWHHCLLPNLLLYYQLVCTPRISSHFFPSFSSIPNDLNDLNLVSPTKTCTLGVGTRYPFFFHSCKVLFSFFLLQKLQFSFPSKRMKEKKRNPLVDSPSLPLFDCLFHSFRKEVQNSYTWQILVGSFPSCNSVIFFLLLLIPSLV